MIASIAQPTLLAPLLGALMPPGGPAPELPPDFATLLSQLDLIPGTREGGSIEPRGTPETPAPAPETGGEVEVEADLGPVPDGLEEIADALAAALAAVHAAAGKTAPLRFGRQVAGTPPPANGRAAIPAAALARTAPIPMAVPSAPVVKPTVVIATAEPTTASPASIAKPTVAIPTAEPTPAPSATVVMTAPAATPLATVSTIALATASADPIAASEPPPIAPAAISTPVASATATPPEAAVPMVRTGESSAPAEIETTPLPALTAAPADMPEADAVVTAAPIIPAATAPDADAEAPTAPSAPALTPSPAAVAIIPPSQPVLAMEDATPAEAIAPAAPAETPPPPSPNKLVQIKLKPLVARLGLMDVFRAVIPHAAADAPAGRPTPPVQAAEPAVDATAALAQPAPLPTAIPAAAPSPQAVPFSAPAPLAAAEAQPQSASEMVMTHHLDLARDGEWLDRLARDIARTADHDARLRFQLNPEHLGSLRVELATTGDGAAIRLTADTEAARNILIDAQPRLIAEARAQGLRISETQVDLGGHGGQQRGKEENPQTFVRTQHRRDESATPSPRSAAERYA